MTNQKIVKNIPFVIQVSLIMFLIMVVLCIPLMLYSNHTILRLSEGEIANAALSNIEATRRLNENIMTRVSDGVLRFIRNQDFVRYSGLQKYSSIQGNVENGLKVRNIQNELITMVKNDEAIHSIFLFFNDADYVISTDRGVVELIDYFPLTLVRSLSTSRKGMGGFWTPRELHAATLRDISVGNDTDDLYGITLGLEWKPYHNFRFKPELRYDYSDTKNVFGNGKHRYQISYGFGISYEF